VLVIDDGSTDETAAIAERAGATVIRHPFNLGIGGAVQSGYKHAFRNGYDVAVQVDGDGQHDPRYLQPMLEHLHTSGEADMVCGSRFRGEEAGYAVPRARRAGIRVFRLMLSAMLGQKITDPTSGFRMVNRRGIELFARDYPHDYPEVEALLMLRAHKLQLHEFPVRMRERDTGVSSIGFTQSAYYMVRVSLALFIGLFRRQPVPSPGQQLLPGLPIESES
jgi:glycosyltransferase involved in cell wall biosynthesis